MDVYPGYTFTSGFLAPSCGLHPTCQVSHLSHSVPTTFYYLFLPHTTTHRFYTRTSSTVPHIPPTHLLPTTYHSPEPATHCMYTTFLPFLAGCYLVPLPIPPCHAAHYATDAVPRDTTRLPHTCAPATIGYALRLRGLYTALATALAAYHIPASVCLAPLYNAGANYVTWSRGFFTPAPAVQHHLDGSCNHHLTTCGVLRHTFIHALLLHIPCVYNADS